MTRWWAPASLVLVTSMITMLPWIGSYPLLPEWEPHYGQVVREMMDRGEWLDPTYRGRQFFDKPILPFLMELVSFSIFGETEFAVRIPMALSGIAGVLAFYFLVGRIYGRRVALIGGLMLATTPFYYLVARQFMFDIPYVALQTAALLCLVIGAIPDKDGNADPKRRKFLIAMWVLTGFAFISKGALAIVIPGAIGVVYILITFDWRIIKRLEPWWGIPVFLLVASPWFIFMLQRHGTRFLEEFFYEHHIQRIAGQLDKPGGTFEFYVLQLGVGLMPWVTLLPLGLAHAFGNWKLRLDKSMWREAFLRIAFLSPFVFYTLSSTKFPHYMLPAVPFLVLLMACAIGKELENPERKTSRLLWVLAAVAVALIAKDLLEGRNYRLIFYIFTTHRLQDFHPMVANPHIAFAIIFALVGVVVLIATFRGRLGWKGFFALLFLNIGYGTYLNSQMVPGLCNMFSSKGLVERYMELREEGEILADCGTWKTRALTFYLPIDQRLLRISNNAGSIRSLFSRRPGQRVFLTVLRKDLDEVMEHARRAGEELHIVGDDRYEDYIEILLLSNEIDPDEDPRAQAVMDSRPSPASESEAVFDSKIRLLGADVSPRTPRRGQTVSITFYFECLEDMEDNAQIFVHIEPQSGGQRLVHDHHPVRNRFTTSRWQQGDIIRDDFEVTIPANGSTGEYRVLMGFFTGDGRLQVRPASESVGANRVEAIRFTVR